MRRDGTRRVKIREGMEMGVQVLGRKGLKGWDLAV